MCTYNYIRMTHAAVLDNKIMFSATSVTRSSGQILYLETDEKDSESRLFIICTSLLYCVLP